MDLDRIASLDELGEPRVVDWIEAHLAESFTLADLAAQAALSEFHFARMFRVSMGVTPHTWVAQRRFARARPMRFCSIRGRLRIRKIKHASG